MEFPNPILPLYLEFVLHVDQISLAFPDNYKKMREYNLLDNYPKPKEKRYVGDNLRTIEHRIVASYRDKIFFDGDRFLPNESALQPAGSEILLMNVNCKFVDSILK